MVKSKSNKPTILKLSGMTFVIAPPPPPAPAPTFSAEAMTAVDALRAECEAAPDRRVACVDFLMSQQRFFIRGKRGGRPQFDFRIECLPGERNEPLMAKHLVKSIDRSADDLLGIVDGLLKADSSAELNSLAERFAYSCDYSRIWWTFDQRVEATRARR